MIASSLFVSPLFSMRYLAEMLEALAATALFLTGLMLLLEGAALFGITGVLALGVAMAMISGLLLSGGAEPADAVA